MAAPRPDNADERLVADALQRAFGEPVSPADFHAGREAVLAAAAETAERVAADTALVGTALTAAYIEPLDPEVVEAGAAAVRAAAGTGNVVPFPRRMVQRAGRHAVAAVVAVGTMAGTSGVAAASSSALPGEMLYPVKRAVEQVMLTAAITSSSEARMQTRIAARRLEEVELLLASGAAPEVVQPLLTEYEQHVAVARELADPEVADDVAVLEEKAETLRDATATTIAVAVPDSPATATPIPQASPTVTTTEAPATADPEPSDTPSEEAASTEPPTASVPTRTDEQPAAQPTAEPEPSPSPEPSPTTDPSPSPSPSPTSEPGTTRPPQSEVDQNGGVPPGQTKDKPNRPSPSPSPSVNPERTPLSDSAPLNDWEEQSYTDDIGHL